VFQVAPSEAVLVSMNCLLLRPRQALDRAHSVVCSLCAQSVRVTAKQSAIAILAQVLAIVTGIANFAVAFLK
jgi:hypothetical protein